ncbi:hypothetical protein, partial [Pantoea vagans]|uniref:hypothetical protein n=1 Tax=Pantoea vagans TaxID=470934 RepID=UPI001C9CC56C
YCSIHHVTVVGKQYVLWSMNTAAVVLMERDLSSVFAMSPVRRPQLAALDTPSFESRVWAFVSPMAAPHDPLQPHASVILRGSDGITAGSDEGLL